MLKETDRTNHEDSHTVADQVEIVYYTDPLCCWSWAFEPQWRKLLYEFNGKIKWQYNMGGLLSTWKKYNDEINIVSKPIQMGPLWMEAGHISGMPIQNRIWMEDPPASSYPACIAVKCVQLQSNELGERYLRLVREAIMLHGKNISRQDVLIEMAEILVEEQGLAFDISRFKDDMKNDNGIEAFRKDLQQVQARNISRFPTLILKYSNRGIIITGFRPYSVLIDVIKQIAPGIERTQTVADANSYEQYWGNITDREREEAIQD